MTTDIDLARRKEERAKLAPKRTSPNDFSGRAKGWPMRMLRRSALFDVDAVFEAGPPSGSSEVAQPSAPALSGAQVAGVMVAVQEAKAPPFPADLLSDLYRLSQSDPPRALRLLLGSFNSAFIAGAFDAVDKVLSQLDVERLEPSVLVGALTITSYARPRLASRALFVQRTESSLNGRIGVERTRALLAARR